MGGIRVFYFMGLESHTLELTWYNYWLPKRNFDWLIVSITPKLIVYSFSRTVQLPLKTSKAAVDGLICFQFACVFCHLLTDTVNVTLQITRTKVPSSDTTYVCQVFDLPSDKPYHMFGTKPIIDNPYVMHHTIMYGCTDDVGEWAKLLTSRAIELHILQWHALS